MEMKEIRIRNISSHDYEQLKKLAERLNYPNLNQFLLSQFKTIIDNESLNYLHNEFADELLELKELQKEINENMVKLQVTEIGLKNQIDQYGQAIMLWLELLEYSMKNVR
ncbi:hypothetical protein CIRMBP1248_02390 [Enterococcus cecorum]|uniref:hypothetical protein n=2 Tax=Enterococcus cecorum TaxID=44008 RepID=UPI00148B7BAB|nr:hypothetical protein [Enterococcus cecorum]MCJ0579030.1 hypothetical protein [Enterococcus cecorum]MCJ0581199.1 hypothetical protein [Enterococcus cecorum]MCJ0586246.1 hypothetical protein [Enterococcus cecorum]MDZ5584785.1 hypothetical protein [Enterococcus cecorum]CAI3372470.1 hypothetical protein CIRMBP1272_01253 [Enterococcus cecorum]